MSADFADAWLAAMARASWQGGLALALAWAVCRAVPHLPAAARCWVWRLAYLKVLVAVLNPAPLDLPLLRAPERVGPVVTFMRPARVPPAGRVPPVADTSDGRDVPVSAPAGGVISVAPSIAPELDPDPASGADPPSATPRTMAALLFVAWSLGIICFATRLVAGFRTTVRLRRRAKPLSDAMVVDVSAMLSRKYRIGRPPPLCTADLPGGPLLLGLGRPVIVLPAGWFASPADRPPADQLRLMLAHELAHVRRRDLGWNALAAACHGLLFFHPLAWLAAREYALARESACDAAALAATGARPGEYGRMLLGVVARIRDQHQPRRILPAPSPVAAAGVAGSAATLHRRLTAMQSNRPWSRRRLALAAAVLALAGTIALVPWRVVAQPRRDRPQEQQSSPDAAAAPAEKPADLAAPGTDAREGRPGQRPAGRSGEAVKVFRLRHALANSVAEQLPAAAQKSGDPALRRWFAGGSVGADERTNSLVVRGPAATLPAVGKLVNELDGAADPNTPADPTGRRPGTGRAGSFPAPRKGPNDEGGGGGAPRTIAVVGRLVSATAEIRAPADGTVSEVRAKEGDRVKKGDVLFQLDDRRAKLVLVAAEAQLQAAQAAYQRVEARQKSGVSTGAEVGAEELAGKRDEAIANLELAKQAMAESRVVAPFAGIVSSTTVQPGAVVSRGARLGTVVEVDTLKVEFDVDEATLARLRVGQELRLRRPSSPDTFPARVSFISPEVDPGSGTVRVKAEVDSAGGRLRPGAAVQVLVPLPDEGAQDQGAPAQPPPQQP